MGTEVVSMRHVGGGGGGGIGGPLRVGSKGVKPGKKVSLFS